MRVVQVLLVPDADGVLRFDIRTGADRAEQYEVAVVLTPVEPAVKPKTSEELGSPPGYFDRTAGAVTDPTFERADQPPLS